MRLRHHLHAALALLLFAGIIPLATGQVRQAPRLPRQPGPPGSDGTRFILRFAAGTPAANRAASVQRAGASLRFNYQTVDAAAITVPNANALTALRQDRSIIEIVPDRRIYAMQKGKKGPPPPPPPPPFGTRQIIPVGVQRVGLPTTTSDGTGVGVAVADTGIDLTHTDLSVSTSKFDSFGGTCQDVAGHGTHISGIIAALNNNQDVVGVAPGAKLYCVKVLDDAGQGTDSTAIAGLDWIAANHNAVTPRIRVVNISWGRLPDPGETLDPPGPLRQAIQALYNLGIVVVAAAGNDPSLEVSALVPAGYPEVLAAAGTVAEPGPFDLTCAAILPGPVLADTASFFTTDGAFNTSTHIGVTASAPGDERESTLFDGIFSCFLAVDGILSTSVGGGISRATPQGEAIGTSFSTPHVAGVVARIIQVRGLTGVENIRSELRNTTDQHGAAPLDHPWAAFLGYTFDGEREGIAQAPH